MKKWSDEIEDARGVVEQIVKRIGEGIQVFGNGGKGFHNDTFEIVLVEEERKRIMIVTWEEIVNAKTNSTELEDRVRKVWEAESTEEDKEEHS
ncbi:MAG: hypothetical protein V3R96_04795 [Dehalococcoidales bacterium]